MFPAGQVGSNDVTQGCRGGATFTDVFGAEIAGGATTLTVGVGLSACCGVGVLTVVVDLAVATVPEIVFTVGVAVDARTTGGVVDIFVAGVVVAGVASFGGETNAAVNAAAGGVTSAEIALASAIGGLDGPL